MHQKNHSQMRDSGNRIQPYKAQTTASHVSNNSSQLYSNDPNRPKNADSSIHQRVNQTEQLHRKQHNQFYTNTVTDAVDNSG